MGIGVWVSRRAGSSTSEFFLSGRTMPWWMLGMSMVATTFSTDTPNLVTDFVRQGGVAKNWSWWAFLVTGMVTTFIYARLWRRSGSLTDMEFYELRYSGKEAAFLRGFRALYLGVVFNVLTMAGVTLAAIKIGGVMLGLEPLETILIASIVTAIFSSLGGFRGVIITDCILFVTAMVGAVVAAYYALDHEQIGGLSGLLSHPNVADKLSLLPSWSDDKDLFITVLLIPLAVQWWAAWYPGAEPGGGGYIVQRMLAAKDEQHALRATLFFNIVHYAVRPWPWIIVALCSLVVYPDLESIAAAFPNIEADKLGHDLGYPAMLAFVPSGWIGLILASLIAAYMSTISTHLNWGASYVVHDFYQRFVRPEASEGELVWAGRVFTVVQMVLAASVALMLSNAQQLFDIIIMFGAGTGLIFLLRWFVPRINAWGELAAMVASGVIALCFTFMPWDDPATANTVETLGASFGYWAKPLAVALTTLIWIVTVLLTPPVDPARLAAFNARIKPLSTPFGWALLATVLGCLTVYAALFATGWWIYGETTDAAVATGVLAVAGLGLAACLPKVLNANAGDEDDDDSPPVLTADGAGRER
ncbi:MAG: SSS family solute:Na+ symporter [Pseudohongiellaceae bacterium]